MSGLLHGVRIAGDVQRMVMDNFVTVVLRRPVSGVDSFVTAFRTRIAMTATPTATRDARAVIGDAPAQYYTMPCYAYDVRPDDTVWAGNARYRVVGVDQLPGGGQALLQGIG